MTETAVATSKAMVYNYDAATKGWVQKGKGTSRLDLYYNAATNSFRVIGRTQENEVVLNAAYFKTMNYSKASDQFHQWTDTRGGYGLNFTSKDDADKFYAATINAIQKLNAATPPPASPIPAPVPAPAPTPPAPSTPPTTAPRPTAPPTPTAPPAMAPPPPASPSSISGPPPPPSGGGPPPPPPGPSGGGPPPPPGPPSFSAPASSGGGSLAEQLAKAKLRKTEPPPESPSLGGGVVGATNSASPSTEAPAPAPRPSGGGMDMMSELQKKLARKIATAATPPPPAADALEAPGTPKGTPPPPAFGSPSATKFSAPKTTASTKMASGDDIESLRQELKELKEEFRAFKAEMYEKFKS